jgi:DNA-binding PadR family transcriptional regulator
LVPGTLYMLVLKVLALEPMHGYGIGVRLKQISKGVFQVNVGSLFPALRRLERDGLIAVFAPIPSPRVNTATTKNTGDFDSIRIA